MSFPWFFAADSSTALLLPLAAVAGAALDRLFGEPRRGHPLVAFGKLANACERVLNVGSARHLRGLLAWALLVLPFAGLALWAIPGGLPGANNPAFSPRPQARPGGPP